MVDKTYSHTFNPLDGDYSHFTDETEVQKCSVTLLNLTWVVSDKVVVLIHCSLLLTRAAVPESVLTGCSSTISCIFSL